MKIKTLKYVGLTLALAMTVPMITGCNQTETKQVQEQINYTKVEVGEVPFLIVDEYGDENKFVRQWMLDNKETEGLYTKLFEGNTYVMYATGEKSHYGYGIGGVSLYKASEEEPILMTVMTTEPEDLSTARQETNYPYVCLKVEGNIKDEFKEEIINLSNQVFEVEGEDFIESETDEHIHEGDEDIQLPIDDIEQVQTEIDQIEGDVIEENE